MITISHLTKTYGGFRAVDDVTFTAQPGRVTGFLGPNGAGKSTTMRIMVGLTPATSGSATVSGRRFADLPNPGLEVGVLLDASAQHAGRTGRETLTIAADTMGLPRRRVDEMLELVSLTSSEAKRRVRNYSLGMRQRLGIGTALLGDPRVLILDEPANGLDPEGIRWMREFLRAFASQGRTVFVSSHLLSEMEQLADDIIIIAAGQLIKQGRVSDIVGQAHTGVVRVRTPQASALSAELIRVGAQVQTAPDGSLQVTGAEPGTVGRAALTVQAELHELVLDRPDLEQVFLELTHGKAGIR